MIRTSIRRISNKSIPYEPVPKNKYNAQRSQFNFKPQKTSGLVHNPPAAIIKPYMQTPNIFLPANDPRRHFNTAPSQNFTQQDLEYMPVLKEYKPQGQRDYSITAETIDAIKKLKESDPENWTLSKLSKEFNIEARKLVHFLRPDKKEKISEHKILSERARRKELWLRNEY
ncbi:mitochondrial ribosomal protein MRPL20p [Spathaspora passalidarum NRRL Y-27907]|uniref:Mitochondrial ribosomal protein MRPL20p n=1 Tax=Spathaspora passalidarum (strain NRRL Y-27907 / 11-Y1) TaxID=619300 RepID=G3APJ6_SPAPN|nr:mitochondrial ribosomal protein MRPL20p [Spathaspora passalidarum NRRL Y-27907]EGW32167.1 mitochondrial ribosomal protein MRPL20p [Spathaspora passalidarum NRRL Y-27907]